MFVVSIFCQEDKEAMFDCYDTIHAVLQVTTGVMSTLKVRVLVPCNIWKLMEKENVINQTGRKYHAMHIENLDLTFLL